VYRWLDGRPAAGQRGNQEEATTRRIIDEVIAEHRNGG
jgi:hypothetical protein